MKNKQVVEEFLKGNEAKTKHLFIEKNVVYSYGYHYPLCVALDNFTTFIINSDNYSMTTAHHKRLIKNRVSIAKFCNTKKLKEIIDKNIKTSEELFLSKI
jgi:hypothetical protein